MGTSNPQREQRACSPRRAAIVSALAGLLFVLSAAPAGAVEVPPPPEAFHDAQQMDQEVGDGHGGGHLTNWWGHSMWSEREYQNGPFAFAIINFVILLWLLGKFARKPFVGYLDTRHATIRDNLAEATRMRAEAKSKLVEIQHKLDGLDREIAEIKAHVAKDAELEKQRIVADAHKEADRIVQQADKTLEKDLRHARQLLEREAVDAAMAAAESLIRQKITDADRSRINEEYFAEVTSAGESN